MNKIYDRLKKIEGEENNISCSLVGVGKMGEALISQVTDLPGMDIRVSCSHDKNRTREAYLKKGLREEDLLLTEDLDLAREAYDRGKYIITENSSICYGIDGIDACVDATGRPDFGAVFAEGAIENGKHLILLDVELDACIGPILKKRAEEKGLVYTGSAGDEPGAIVELVDFSKSIGLKVLSCGKGKNNRIDRYANPKSLKDEAEKKKLSPRLLTSFVDSTNTMIELNSVCNALGFLPDVDGCHGIETDRENCARDFSIKSEGGHFSSYDVVDYAMGMAPGVFCIVTSEDEDLRDLLSYLGLGQGPNFCLYRPFHLTSLETPRSIFRAVIDGDSTIEPVKGQVADTVTVAKRDLKAGDRPKGIGEEDTYGILMSHEKAKRNDYVPIPLINGDAIINRDIKRGEYISYSDLTWERESRILQLRRDQDLLELDK